jgi:glycerophosphoryl diester phosphodiesterase
VSRLPLVIAHRGDSAHRPENTLASFASALELGAELVELDVQLTKDGHAVVIHDPTLDRTTTGRGRVRDHSLSEIRRLSAGYPERFGSAFAGERVPTLAEVLHLLRGRARALVEIKHESVSAAEDDGIEALTIAEARKAGVTEGVALLSFDRRALVRCRRQAPEIPRGHIFYRATAEEVLAGVREAGTDLVLPEKGMLSEELVRSLHAARLRVATWVVDEPDELRALARYQLFGVGSNRPGVLLEAIAEGALGGGHEAIARGE